MQFDCKIHKVVNLKLTIKILLKGLRSPQESVHDLSPIESFRIPSKV